MAVAMMVAVPASPCALRRGTITVPVPWLVVAVAVFAPSAVKRPLSVVRVTTIPFADGLPAESVSAAVMVVELEPSATSDVAPAPSVMPTTSVTVGVVGAVVVVVVEGASAFFPSPVLSHPARIPR